MFCKATRDSSRSILVVSVALLALHPISARGQAGGKVGSQFIPPDGVAVIVASPSALMSSPATEFYPWEIADAWMLDNAGLAASDCESVKMVIASPGPGVPGGGLIIKMKKPISINDLNEELLGEEVMVDQYKCVRLAQAGPGIVHQMDDRTLVMASEDYLDNLMAVSEGNQNGELARLADAAPHRGHLTVLGAMSPVRPMLMGLLQMMGNEIPPPFQRFLNAPELIDAALLNIDLDDKERGISLTLLAPDEPAANELRESILAGLQLTRDLILQQVMAELDDPQDPVQRATASYAQRMGVTLLDDMTPEQSGRRLTFAAGSPTGMMGIHTQAVLAAMLLPAIQQARFAARRASNMNNMKQIGLAMHNYHSAYRKLPGASIDDENGKPLLSWRVAILPFIEEQNLYQQFHLDEPWDSDHNIKLLPMMPKIYEDPNVAVEPGKTIFHAPVGEGLMFQEGKEMRFRDVLDGLSNSIMVFQANPDEAVPWTKPVDVKLDMDAADASFFFNQGATTVLMGDGAVRTIEENADGLPSNQIKEMLTIQGKEIINNF